MISRYWIGLLSPIPLNVWAIDYCRNEIIGEREEGEGNARVAVQSLLPDWLRERWRLVLVGVAGALLLMGWIGETFLHLPAVIVLALFLLSYLTGGYDIATHAFPGLLRENSIQMC